MEGLGLRLAPHLNEDEDEPHTMQATHTLQASMSTLGEEDLPNAGLTAVLEGSQETMRSTVGVQPGGAGGLTFQGTCETAETRAAITQPRAVPEEGEGASPALEDDVMGLQGSLARALRISDNEEDG